jgi:small multidrug resistance family-3 protein
MLIAQSALLFFLAGLAEIAGGYLMWIWLRRAEPAFLGIIGAAILVLYGVIPTFQPQPTSVEFMLPMAECLW